MLKKITLLLVVFTVLMSFASSILASAETVIAIENFQPVYENNKAALLIGINDFAGQIAVYQKDTKKVFYSNPKDAENSKLHLNKYELKSVLVMSYYDDAGSLNYVNSLKDAVLNGGLKAKKSKSGASYELYFKDIKVRIAIDFNLNNDGSLTVKIPLNKFKEEGNVKIYSVTAMPYFTIADTTENGFIFVPDGSGAVINLNNGKTAAEPYYESIYGDDYSDFDDEKKIKKEKIYLPVFGIKRSNDGIFSVVEKGECQSKIYAGVSGRDSDYNIIKNEFILRKVGKYSFAESWMGRKEFYVFQEGPSTVDSLSLRFFFLEEKATLSDMATLYRNYLLQNKELNHSSQKPESLFTFAGAASKNGSFLGFPIERKIPLTTYTDALKFAQWINENNIKNATIRYIGADNLSVEGKVASSFSPISSLGGRKKFSELNNYLGKQKINMFPDINPITFSKTAFVFEEMFIGSRTVGDSVIKGYFYKANILSKDTAKKPFYLIKPSLLENNAKKLALSLKKQNLSSVSLSVITDKLYSDFSKNGSERYRTAEYVRAYLKVLKNEKLNIMANKPNANYLKYIDIITEMPSSSSGFDIFNYDFPFYQLVVSGYIPYCSVPLNLEPNMKNKLLRSIAYGEKPNYMLVKSVDNEVLDDSAFDYITGGEIERWKKTILENNEILNNFKEPVTDIEIIGKDIIKTIYNDKTVIFNLSDEKFNYNGLDIMPTEYFITESEK